MFDRLDDTIVAISSPSGVGVRGVVRLSGPDAFPLAARAFAGDDGQPLTSAPGHHRIAGRLHLGPGASVPAEAYTFRAPASYTRQDVVELHTVGSPAVLAIALEQLTRGGARSAEPGEFTARAFFSGAMDLTRVEGVAAIIHARSDAQLRASEALLHGQLSRRSTVLRDELADLLALVEAEIDFAEEPMAFVSREQVITSVDRGCEALASLLCDAPSQERLEMLPEVMLVGPRNAGKSTLFNRLSGMDRAMASATAGTTRDVLRAPVAVARGEILLLDSAGIGCDADPRAPAGLSVLDELAEAATRRAIASADLLLLTVDIGAAPREALAALRSALPDRPAIIVANKIDRLVAEEVPLLAGELAAGGHVCPVSALTGAGVASLRAEIGRTLFSGVESHASGVLALSDRQRGALCDALDSLRRARRTCEELAEVTDGAELLALEIREAMNALSLLTGEVTTDELLGRIFSRFCIGK